MSELLCIGGIAAGKKYKITNGNSLEVPVMKPLGFYAQGNELPSETYLSTQTYRKEQLYHTDHKNGKERLIEMLVWDRINTSDIFDELFKSYSDVSEIKRQNEALRNENAILSKIKHMAKKLNDQPL